jgi:hypothetical protein
MKRSLLPIYCTGASRKMKRATIVAVVMCAAVAATANAAPSAEEAVVSLVAGYCLSQKTGAPLPTGAIDPRTAGTPLTSRDRLARLSNKAVRLPTASGDVYYDYNETYCYAHASGVDRARTIAGLEDELKRLRLSFAKTPVKHQDGPAKDGKRYPDLVILIDPPVGNAGTPMIAITYFDDPNELSIGVAIGR